MDSILKTPSKVVREFKRLPRVQQLVLVVIIALAAYWLHKNYITRREGFNASNSVLNCTMYYVDWCPHCKDAKPEWKKIMDSYNGKTVNGKKIIVTSIDCEKTPEGIAAAKKAGVESYPTFKFDLDGQELKFSGERTYPSFKKFIDSQA